MLAFACLFSVGPQMLPLEECARCPMVGSSRAPGAPGTIAQLCRRGLSTSQIAMQSMHRTASRAPRAPRADVLSDWAECAGTGTGRGWSGGGCQEASSASCDTTTPSAPVLGTTVEFRRLRSEGAQLRDDFDPNSAEFAQHRPNPCRFRPLLVVAGAMTNPIGEAAPRTRWRSYSGRVGRTPHRTVGPGASRLIRACMAQRRPKRRSHRHARRRS